MASSHSSLSKLPVMPGSFGPEDEIGSYDNPFAALEQLQDSWRSREHRTPWSTDRLSEPDLGEVDWHKYEPPAMLRKAPNVTSQILLDIVASSIDNVKARLAEEDRVKRDEEDVRRTAEEDAAKQQRDNQEPYLPIIIVPEPLPEPAIDDESIRASSSMDLSTEPIKAESMTSSHDQVISAAKAEKRRKFALRRFFHRSSDKSERGESSIMGSAREALRQKLETRLSTIDFDSADPKTQEAIAALRKAKIIKGPDPDELVECVSCLDDIPRKDVIKVPCHSYCADCFVRLVTAAVQNEQQWPPKCCLNQISFRVVLNNIPDELKRTFQERASEWEIPITERVYCHQPECGVWIQPNRINLAKRQGHCDNGHWTCSICRGPRHGTEDCPQDSDLNLTNMLAEEEGWKRCFNCNALVEHREACQHMTCRCGTQFCYVCGLRWRTCRCTMQQLHDLKAQVETRREQKLFREQAEAEELQHILAQIEEFEHEEAARAELERQDQARLEEERWQRQIKERIRQETYRRREVDGKYKELRASLDQLHEVQQVLVEMEQETTATELISLAKAAEDQLAQKHEAQNEEMETSIKAKMSAKEYSFTKDYAIRAAQEKKIEEGYHRQLQAFWCDKVGGDEEIDMAMLPLRTRMDQGYRSWQKWKNYQLDVYQDQLEDEDTIRKELMYSARQRMMARHDDQEMELVRQAVADKKWVQEVILERERLLGGEEVLEMEGDADSLFGHDDD